MSTTSFDFSALSARDQYRLLIGTVVPRPIAWVTTLDPQGRVNAAPFSFFNALSSDPPLIGLGTEARPDGSPKDTTLNIRASGEFTVNIVSNALVEAMSVCSIPFPHGIDELAEAGLTAAPGLKVKCPRIVEARASLECVTHTAIPLDSGGQITLGRIVAAHYASNIVDADRHHVDPMALDAVGRMGGNSYATTRYLFDLDRLSVEQWEADHDPGTRRPREAWRDTNLKR